MPMTNEPGSCCGKRFCRLPAMPHPRRIAERPAIRRHRRGWRPAPQSRVGFQDRSFRAARVSRCVSLWLLVYAYTALASSALFAEDDRGEENWPSYGRTYSEQFYSPLSSINATNVARLGLAWFVDLPGQRMLEATPLAIDGVLYFSGTYGKVFAVDARLGRLLWDFDPHSGDYRPDVFRYTGSLGGHRGVAYWRGKVYVGAVDGRLFALEAKTGKVVWNVQTFERPEAGMTISGAPRAYDDKVVIGSCSDFGSLRGYVAAYDAETGRQRWRFYTVPGDPAKGFESPAMAMAAKTWSGQWWKSGGNGSVWDSIVYDPEFKRIYFGTANWNGDQAPPKDDHLFTSSIVALDANTGSYLWHYQENPRGDRDYDSTMPIVLAELTINGRQHKALLHAPKNGFFYVIDRTTGKLISADPFSKVNWARRIDLNSGRPVELPAVRDLWPGFLGAHSWQPMAFNPETGLVYIPTMKWDSDATELNLLEPDDATASLLAWDPVTQRQRWEVHYADSFWNGGATTTAGNLVFQGTGRGKFVAYKASTGEKLWSFDAGLGIIATPISYSVDGVQYISVLVGYGGAGGLLGKLADYGWRFNEQPRRLLTFALGRRTPLPLGGPPRHDVKAVDDPKFLIDAAQAATGAELYRSAQCYFCHGPELVNTGSFAPDLRESALAMNWDTFKSAVSAGTLAAGGMPKFDDLSDNDLRMIYMYVRQRARAAARAATR